MRDDGKLMSDRQPSSSYAADDPSSNMLQQPASTASASLNGSGSTPIKRSASGVLSAANGSSGAGGGQSPRGGLAFDDDTHRTEALSRLNTMRKEGHLCDAVLKVGSHSMAVHRAVLASCSTYLFERFSSGGAAAGTREDELSRGVGKHQHIKLDGFDPTSVEILINYAYTARLECEMEQVRSVYRTASMLKMYRAAEACSRYLADNLTPQNCLGTRAFASSCYDQELALKSSSFIQEHMQTVLERSPEIHRFPTIIVDIVGVEPSNLSSDGEKPLCKLVVDWLETAAEDTPIDKLAENPLILYLTVDNNLRDCLDEELDVAGLNNIDIVRDYKKLGKRKMMTPLRANKDKAGSSNNSAGRIPNSVTPSSSFAHSNSSSTESLLSMSTESTLIATKRMGDKSFMCLAMLNNGLTRISIKFRPQTPSNGGGSNGLTVDTSAGSVSGCSVDGSRSPAREDRSGARSPVDKQCSLTPLAPMSSARCGLGAAVLNGRLVALGGNDRGECLSSVESFDLVDNSWSALKPMLITRARFAVAEMDGRLYACGGSNGQVDLKSAECYDPSTGVWTALPDMTIQRSNPGVAAVNGRLYVIGGWSGCSGRTLCEIYDVSTGAWRCIADLNVGRSQVAVCALDGGRVVAVGGCDAWNCTNTVEVYNPTDDRWTFLPPMAIARRGAGVAFFKNKLYVVGGSDGQTSLFSVEIFDFSTGLWSAGPSLGTPRANMGVAIVGHRLFAVGGYSGKAFLDSVEYLCDDGDEWCAYQPNVAAAETVTTNHRQLGKYPDNGFTDSPPFFTLGPVNGISETAADETATENVIAEVKTLSITDATSENGSCGISESNGSETLLIAGEDSGLNEEEL